jgi:hypothetical protein
VHLSFVGDIWIEAVFEHLQRPTRKHYCVAQQKQYLLCMSQREYVPDLEKSDRHLADIYCYWHDAMQQNDAFDDCHSPDNLQPSKEWTILI